MSTQRIEPLPAIPLEVASGRMERLAAAVADRGLCTDFKRFVEDPEYRDRWDPEMPRPKNKADREANRAAYVEKARQACIRAGCPVVAECLEMTLRQETGRGRSSAGIAGGAAPWERRELIEQRKRLAERRPAAELAGVAR